MRLKQAALFLLGSYVCLVATIAHRHEAVIDGVEVPWGLVLALIGTYFVARAVEHWVRLGESFFALGWAVGLIAPMISPGGSYLVAADWLGLSFIFGGVGVLVLAGVRGSKAH